MENTVSEEASQLRELINYFINERLETKLKTQSDPDKREALAQQHQFSTWIEQAAKRVNQLQVVTHSLKPIHPDAKGTNLYIPPEQLADHPFVGSHLLEMNFSPDVVGNAAQLDVYKFLRIELNGESLLERALRQDPELIAALSEDRELALEWVSAFAGITEPAGTYASHTRAKQFYWLTGDDPSDDSQFHLLAPLFATSLAHDVFRTINEDRFGESAKAARQARRNGAYSDTEVRFYPDLAIQKFGGSKPQNISQLNSERGGVNYLLRSLPPTWHSPDVRLPLRVASAFKIFGKRTTTRELVRDLRAFLKSDPKPTAATREHRDEFIHALIDELILFTSELHSAEPGWSRHDECDLPEAEAHWLDPDRTRVDEAFADNHATIEWPLHIRQTFAAWLNGCLEAVLPVSDTEYDHWSKQLKERLDELQEVLPHV